MIASVLWSMILFFWTFRFLLITSHAPRKVLGSYVREDDEGEMSCLKFSHELCPEDVPYLVQLDQLQRATNQYPDFLLTHVDRKDPHRGRTALLNCCATKKVEAALWYLTWLYANPNVQDAEGRTALMLVLRHRKALYRTEDGKRLMRQLLGQADYTLQDRKGRTVLEYPVRFHRRELKRAFLAALQRDDLGSVGRLLDRMTDIPATFVSCIRSLEMAQLLHERLDDLVMDAADIPNRSTRLGVLHVAVLKGDLGMVKFLLGPAYQCTATLKAGKGQMCSPLCMAIRSVSCLGRPSDWAGLNAIIELLLEHISPAQLRHILHDELGGMIPSEAKDRLHAELYERLDRTVNPAKYILRYLKDEPGMLPGALKDLDEASPKLLDAIQGFIEETLNTDDEQCKFLEALIRAKAPLWMILPFLTTTHQIRHLMSAFKASDLNDFADEPHPSIGLSVLQKAVLSGQVCMVESLLFNLHANANFQEAKGGNTALHLLLLQPSLLLQPASHSIALLLAHFTDLTIANQAGEQVWELVERRACYKKIPGWLVEVMERRGRQKAWEPHNPDHVQSFMHNLELIRKSGGT